MKTQKKYEEYQKLYIKQTNDLETLDNLYKANQEEIAKCDAGYNEALKKADENKAETFFNKKIELKEEQKKLSNRIKIKKDMANVVTKEKKFETLINAKNLRELYSDDVKTLHDKLKVAVDQYNKVVDEIHALNDKYGEEEHKYRALYDSLSDDERKELKRNPQANGLNFNLYSIASYKPFNYLNDGKFNTMEEK